VIESAKASLFSGGCLLCNASVEMAPVDKLVGNSVQSTIQRLQSAVETAIGSEISDPSRTSALSGLIICTYLGARVLAKAGAPLQMIIDSRDHCRTK